MTLLHESTLVTDQMVVLDPCRQLRYKCLSRKVPSMDRTDGTGQPEDDSVSCKEFFITNTDVAKGMGRWHLRRRGLLQRLRRARHSGLARFYVWLWQLSLLPRNPQIYYRRSTRSGPPHPSPSFTGHLCRQQRRLSSAGVRQLDL